MGLLVLSAAVLAFQPAPAFAAVALGGRNQLSAFPGLNDPPVQLSASGDNVYAMWGEGGLTLRRSTDRGATFDAPIILSGGDVYFSSIASSGSYVYVAWGERFLSGGQSPKIFLTASTNGGKTFDPATVIGTDIYGGIQLVADGSTVYISWTANSLQPDVFFRVSRDAGATFEPDVSSQAVNISNDSKSLYHSMAVVGNNVYISWYRQNPQSADVAFRQSSDSGKSFGNPIVLNSVSAGVPKIAASGNNVYVAWTDQSRTLKLAWSSNSGLAFSPAQSTVTADANYFDIAASGNRLFIAAWGYYSTTVNGVTSYRADLVFARSSNNGQLFRTSVIETSSHYSTHRSVDLETANDNVYLIWSWQRDNGFNVPMTDLFRFMHLDSYGSIPGPATLLDSRNYVVFDKVAAEGDDVYIIWGVNDSSDHANPVSKVYFKGSRSLARSGSFTVTQDSAVKWSNRLGTIGTSHLEITGGYVCDTSGPVPKVKVKAGSLQGRISITGSSIYPPPNPVAFNATLSSITMSVGGWSPSTVTLSGKLDGQRLSSFSTRMNFASLNCEDAAVKYLSLQSSSNYFRLSAKQIGTIYATPATISGQMVFN
ncbi:sialidase family protein [Nitrososphaera sp.]|uniref:sialidase family protein n=1 Tax=Nitrososphaera sp. TaxID=1971748 RepID=UPI00307EE7A5